MSLNKFIYFYNLGKTIKNILLPITNAFTASDEDLIINFLLYNNL